MGNQKIGCSQRLRMGKAQTGHELAPNERRRKQHNEPIRTRSKYMQPAPSAGTRVRAGFASHWL